jgi:hypothetical protein
MRLQVPTDRADLRVTWHRPDDVFTVTLWHGQECVASAPLSPSDAATLAAFVVQHLGERAAVSPAATGLATSVAPSEMGAAIHTPRGRAGWLSRLRRYLPR